MSQTERDGWWIFVVGVFIATFSIVFAIRYGFDWTSEVVLFCGGVSLGVGLGALGIMRGRMYWNRLYGRDLWNDKP